MAAAERENAGPRKEVETAVAVAVEEVRAFGAHVVLVEADGAENLRHLRVHVALVQREAFGAARVEQSLQIERHVAAPCSGVRAGRSAGAVVGLANEPARSIFATRTALT